MNAKENKINNINEIFEILKECGWGKIEIVKSEKKCMLFEIINSPLSYSYLEFLKGKEKIKSCWLEAGIISGILEEIFGKKNEAEEISCRSEGEKIAKY